MMDIHVGQIWAMPSVGDVPPLMVAVFALDKDRNNAWIASVLVVPHPAAKAAGWPRASHLPIQLETLGLDSARLVQQDQDAPPDFTDGYTTWRQKYEAGEAGVFSISVGEAYRTIAAVASPTIEPQYSG